MFTKGRAVIPNSKFRIQNSLFVPRLFNLGSNSADVIWSCPATATDESDTQIHELADPLRHVSRRLGVLQLAITVFW